MTQKQKRTRKKIETKPNAKELFIHLVGKLWRVLRVHPDHSQLVIDGAKCHGSCDAPWRPNKTIYLSNRLKGANLLETQIHEPFHGCFWYIDEEYVTEFSRDLAEYLIRDGWTHPSMEKEK